MFSYLRKAQYHETDQMGMIHHSNHVKWMEEARVAFMDEIGMGYAQVEASSVASPVVGLSVDYRKPVRFADEVEVRVEVKAYDGIRIELAYEFFDRTSGKVCATATSKHCFVKDGRVASLKRELPELDAKFAALVPA